MVKRASERGAECLNVRFLRSRFVEPSRYNKEKNDKPSLWITSDGSLPDNKVEIPVELPKDLPQDAFVHYLYARTTNTFIVIAAMSAAFRWF